MTSFTLSSPAELLPSAVRLKRKQKQDAALKGGDTKAKPEGPCGDAAVQTAATKARTDELGFSRAQIVQRGERGGGGQGVFGGLLSGGDSAG
jgi:hypothetical protein